MRYPIRIKVKHVHDWTAYNTFSGGGTNGSTRICEECGARRRFGTRTKAVKVDGKTYFRDELINEYARKDESYKPIGKTACTT